MSLNEDNTILKSEKKTIVEVWNLYSPSRNCTNLDRWCRWSFFSLSRLSGCTQIFLFTILACHSIDRKIIRCFCFSARLLYAYDSFYCKNSMQQNADDILENSESYLYPLQQQKGGIFPLPLSSQFSMKPIWWPFFCHCYCHRSPCELAPYNPFLMEKKC